MIAVLIQTQTTANEGASSHFQVKLPSPTRQAYMVPPKLFVIGGHIMVFQEAGLIITLIFDVKRDIPVYNG